LWAQTPPDHPGAPPQQFEYLRPGDAFVGVPVNGVDVTMRGINVDWTWDAASGRFMRSQQGSPHVDALHGPIGATNVIVLGVRYRPSQVDARSPEAQTLGTGPMWVFSAGQVIRGTWLRMGPEVPITLFDQSQNVIPIQPGNTWIELAEYVPTDDPENPGVQLAIQFA
jgi:hypothetical protein